MNPADEKAVAELFKCDCGYDEASATCFDSGHDLGCKSRHSDVGTALAARIRADAERETAAALARAERAETLVREVARSGVELDDERIDYVTVQIDRATWGDITRIAELEKP